MKYSLSAKNLVCRNLETKASYCADLLNPGQRKEITGILRADSGLLSVGFNQVISNTVMPPIILQRFVVDYFAERHSPFSLWHCANKPLDDDALADLGLQRQKSLVAMAADIKQLAADEGAPAELEIKPAHSPEEIIVFGGVLAELSDDPREKAQIKKFYQQLSQLPEHKHARLKLFTGFWQGEAAACGTLFSCADALGMYDLGTLGPLRGRGIGSAMLQHLVREVQNSHHKHVVTLVGEDQQDIYLNTGFYAVGELARYNFVPERAAPLPSPANEDDSQDKIAGSGGQ